MVGKERMPILFSHIGGKGQLYVGKVYPQTFSQRGREWTDSLFLQPKSTYRNFWNHDEMIESYPTNNIPLANTFLCKSALTRKNNYLFQTSYLVFKHILGMQSNFCDWPDRVSAINLFPALTLSCCSTGLWAIAFLLYTKKVSLPQKLLSIIEAFVF